MKLTVPFVCLAVLLLGSTCMSMNKDDKEMLTELYKYLQANKHIESKDTRTEVVQHPVVKVEEQSGIGEPTGEGNETSSESHQDSENEETSTEPYPDTDTKEDEDSRPGGIEEATTETYPDEEDEASSESKPLPADEREVRSDEAPISAGGSEEPTSDLTKEDGKDTSSDESKPGSDTTKEERSKLYHLLRELYKDEPDNRRNEKDVPALKKTEVAVRQNHDPEHVERHQSLQKRIVMETAIGLASLILGLIGVAIPFAMPSKDYSGELQSIEQQLSQISAVQAVILEKVQNGFLEQKTQEATGTVKKWFEWMEKWGAMCTSDSDTACWNTLNSFSTYDIHDLDGALTTLNTLAKEKIFDYALDVDKFHCINFKNQFAIPFANIVSTGIRTLKAVKTKRNEHFMEDYWKKEALAVAAKGEEAFTKCHREWKSHMEEDVDNEIMAFVGKSNEDLAKSLKAKLTDKYYWKYWLVIVYNDIRGWYYHAMTGWNYYKKFSYGQKNVVVKHITQDLFTSTSNKYAQNLLKYGTMIYGCKSYSSSYYRRVVRDRVKGNLGNNWRFIFALRRGYGISIQHNIPGDYYYYRWHYCNTDTIVIADPQGTYYDTYNNKNCNGGQGDLGRSSVSSKEKCVEKCMAYDGCQGAVFKPNHNCWLKGRCDSLSYYGSMTVMVPNLYGDACHPSDCKLPFEYDGVTHTACVKTGSYDAWCYKRAGSWRYCHGCNI